MCVCVCVCVPACLPACLSLPQFSVLDTQGCGLSLLPAPGTEDPNWYGLIVSGWVACVPVCLPARLPACLAACLSACLPAFLPACLPARLLVPLPCLSVFFVPACAPARPSACLSVSPSRLPVACLLVSFLCPVVGPRSSGSLRFWVLGFRSLSVGFFSESYYWPAV